LRARRRQSALFGERGIGCAPFMPVPVPVPTLAFPFAKKKNPDQCTDANQ